MEFSEKLSLLRKSNGISQEELADTLGVSRQAVGKWETGQSFPEICTLVKISDHYKISLDRLLKGEENCATSLVERKTDAEEIAEFRCRAIAATYAGYGKEVGASRKKSHDFSYQEGKLFYYDTYLGGTDFAGEEAVWKAEEPMWSMNYCGRVLQEPFSGDFLKEALTKADPSMPYRGPEFYQKGAYTYHCSVTGEFFWFSGREEILYEGKKVYECQFHGGKIC